MTLERGITLEGLDVVVYNASHPIFTKSNLIQIAGRVGRKISDPFGNVTFITNKVDRKLKQVIRELDDKNKMSLL